MCRMCAITATNWPKHLTVPMLDYMTARSVSDEGQYDGWGISVQGRVIAKSPEPYWCSSPEWMSHHKDIDGRMVMSHVRKASTPNDKANPLSPHPYVYHTVDGKVLLLQHNGYIERPDKYRYDSGVPNTDTYRAGLLLLRLLNQQIVDTGDFSLSNDLIEEWTHEFYRGSVYVIFIMYENELIVVRGNSARTMYAREAGNGYIFATSAAVLEVTAARLFQYGIKIGVITRNIPEYSISRVTEGQHDLDTSSYEPLFLEYPALTHGAKSHPNAAASAAGAASKAEFGASSTVTTAMVVRREQAADQASNGRAVVWGWNDDDDEVEVLARSDGKVSSHSRPRRSPTTNATALEEEISRAVFARIRTNLNPLRVGSILLWLADTYGLTDAKGTPDLNAALDLPVSDLQDFIDYVVPGSIAKGETKKPGDLFSSYQKQIINLFNRLVPSTREREISLRYYNMFGLYWLNTESSLETIQYFVDYLLSVKTTEPGTDSFLSESPSGEAAAALE